MRGRIARATAAELVKLRGLPVVLVTAAVTVAAAIAFAAASASSAPPRASTGEIVAQTIGFVQIGPVLIGVLAAATEYSGRQIATTLIASPRRLVTLAGKAVALSIATASVGVLAVGAATATAWATRGAHGARGSDAWPLAGAVVYLVLIGLLALALAILLRSLIAPLVTMLVMVLVLSPLLAGYTEHVRWLPDRAGSLLYLPNRDAVLTPGGGALVLIGWIAVVGTAACIAYLRRDA